MPGLWKLPVPVLQGCFHRKDTAKSTLLKNLPMTANESHNIPLTPNTTQFFWSITVQKTELTKHTCNFANFGVLVLSANAE